VYQEDQQNWINAFNLALYLLAAGESEEAERLNRKILSLGVPRYNILEAIHDLDDFLALFPRHLQAQAMRVPLQSSLEIGEPVTHRSLIFEVHFQELEVYFVKNKGLPMLFLAQCGQMTI